MQKLRVKLHLDLGVNDESIEALCVEIVKKKKKQKQILESILTISNLLSILSNVSHIIP